MRTLVEYLSPSCYTSPDITIATMSKLICDQLPLISNHFNNCCEDIMKEFTPFVEHVGFDDFSDIKFNSYRASDELEKLFEKYYPEKTI